MSGHSKWANIKHRKGAVDAKRSKTFSYHAKVIAIFAKNDPNPETNPSLRAAINRAREDSVPSSNIERAIKKANEVGNLEQLRYEAYGPEGVAILIDAITDNNNRTFSEIRKVLSDNNSKIAEPGSVLWSFEKKEDGWIPKFPQKISGDAKKTISKLTETLNDHDDVKSVTTNAE
jgi:YebC/PmpR family DNA-binding regulatory protein